MGLHKFLKKKQVTPLYLKKQDHPSFQSPHDLSKYPILASPHNNIFSLPPRNKPKSSKPSKFSKFMKCTPSSSTPSPSVHFECNWPETTWCGDLWKLGVQLPDPPSTPIRFIPRFKFDSNHNPSPIKHFTSNLDEITLANPSFEVEIEHDDVELPPHVWARKDFWIDQKGWTHIHYLPKEKRCILLQDIDEDEVDEVDEFGVAY